MMITPLKQEKAKKFGELDKIKIIEIMTCFSVNLQLIRFTKSGLKLSENLGNIHIYPQLNF